MRLVGNDYGRIAGRLPRSFNALVVSFINSRKQETMKPYYQDEHCTIYHGDCREILPTIGTFDLLLADPPYGIGEARGKNKSRSCLATSKDYGVDFWDDNPVAKWAMLLARELCEKQVIFGGNYYDLPATKCWLIWDKVNGENDFADCELAWTNLEKAVRMKHHQWHGMIRKGQEQRFHPTQKPLEVMSWALAQAGEVATVLDPWMGSGTTLRACKDVGIKCVGIEREEKYCEIAVRRLAQECLAL
jgi:DNA modification methylase